MGELRPSPDRLPPATHDDAAHRHFARRFGFARQIESAPHPVFVLVAFRADQNHLSLE